jgi:hypothetical protein
MPVREVYFAVEKVPFMYDIDAGRLYEMAGGRQVEVDNHLVIRKVRFHSTEISLDGALELIRGTETTQ